MYYMLNKRTVDHHYKAASQICYRVTMTHLWLIFMTYQYTRENVLLIYLKFCPYGVRELSH